MRDGVRHLRICSGLEEDADAPFSAAAQACDSHAAQVVQVSHELTAPRYNHGNSEATTIRGMHCVWQTHLVTVYTVFTLIVTVTCVGAAGYPRCTLFTLAT